MWSTQPTPPGWAPGPEERPSIFHQAFQGSYWLRFLGVRCCRRSSDKGFLTGQAGRVMRGHSPLRGCPLVVSQEEGGLPSDGNTINSCKGGDCSLGGSSGTGTVPST